MKGWPVDGQMTETKTIYMLPVLSFMKGWPDDGQMTETKTVHM
jgi:hypothetical protein